LLPQSLPLPLSPTRANQHIDTVRAEMLDPGIVSRVSLELMKSLLSSAEVKSNARVGHDALVRRRAQAANVVDKRDSEHQRAVAEVQALEQLLELSTVADGKGVPQASLEERLAMLSDAVSAADLLAPPSHEEKLPKVSSTSTPPSAMKGLRASETIGGKAQTSKAIAGGLGGSKVGKVTTKEPAKGSSGVKEGWAKKGKPSKGEGSETAMVPQADDDVKREFAAKIVQAAVRGRQLVSDAQKKDLAAKRVQAALRSRRARGNGLEHLATGDGVIIAVQKVECKALIAETPGERNRDLKKSPPAKSSGEKAAVKRTLPTTGNKGALNSRSPSNVSKEKKALASKNEGKHKAQQLATPSKVAIAYTTAAKAGAGGKLSTAAPSTSAKGMQADRRKLINRAESRKPPDARLIT